ncbi:hypothetical protein JCM11641_001768 [Rhodosporidiobolus odoratus]
MKSYYYDDIEGDQRLAHHSGEDVTVEDLNKIGVLAFVGIGEDRVEAIAKERGYKNRDEINVSKAGMGDIYEEKIKGFFKEHLHEDEEIRYIKEGRGYFDVRGAFIHSASTILSWIRAFLAALADPPTPPYACQLVLDTWPRTPLPPDPSQTRWIRVAVEPRDLLIVPAGIFHRFTLDSGDFIKAVRLFQDEPKWVPHNKAPELEQNPHRVQYLSSLQNGIGSPLSTA